MQPSFEVYYLTFSALENWDEKPEAVVAIFSAMRKAYPSRRLLADTNTNDAADSSLSRSSSMDVSLSDEDTKPIIDSREIPLPARNDIVSNNEKGYLQPRITSAILQSFVTL